MKTVFACVAILASGFVSVAAVAQQNPFVPPQGGLSKDQIQAIVRQEIARSGGQSSTPTKDPNAKGGKTGVPGLPGANGGNAGVQSQMKGGADHAPQQQGGMPMASTAAAKAEDPVADLLKEGGNFVGCVGMTPVFKDKVGRRAYFTSKELRESNEARRFARCS